MEDMNAIVGLIESLEQGAEADTRAQERGLAVETVMSVAFRDGQTGLLDLAEPRGAVWASVLQSLLEQGAPVYVEIDPRTAMITELLQPKLQPVGDITPLDEGPDLQVQLLRSHARHVLRRDHPRFEELLHMLRDAQGTERELWVTETLNTHEIIDVRPARLAPH